MSAKIRLNCRCCGHIFYRYKIKIRAGFCSRSCWARYQSKEGKVLTKCSTCGKEFKKNRSRILRSLRNYCSIKCRNIGKSIYECGENSQNWKGGKTSESIKIRHSKKYKEWRDAIFKRDNYTCRWCGVRGGTLNADHIKPFSTNPELRFWIGNGRTLCLSCHKLTNTYLYKARYNYDKRLNNQR